MIKSWSFSRYKTYRQCPQKLKFTALDRLKEPSNAAMSRGNTVHTLAENFIQSKDDRLVPPELTKVGNLLIDLRSQQGRVCVEEQWALTEQWKPTTWFASDVWLRVKVDALLIEDDMAFMHDWKTGKFRTQSAHDYQEQLELYCLATFLMKPKVNFVDASLEYTDIGMSYPKQPTVVSRDSLPDLKEVWISRVHDMLNDTMFSPTPNRLCDWCHFRNSNGGPCDYG